MAITTLLPVILRFVNVGFTVMSGANLVFDMPKTKFGPNTEVSAVQQYEILALLAEYP